MNLDYKRMFEMKQDDWIEVCKQVDALKVQIEGPDGLNSLRHRVTMYFKIIEELEVKLATAQDDFKGAITMMQKSHEREVHTNKSLREAKTQILELRKILQSVPRELEKLADIHLNGQGNLSEANKVHSHDALLVASGWIENFIIKKIPTMSTKLKEPRT